MIRLAAAAVSAVAGIGCLLATWLSGSGVVPTLDGAELPGLRWLLFALVATQLMGTFFLVLGRTARVAIVAVVGEVAAACLALLALEVAPGLLPRGVVSSTVRRSALDVGAGLGPWLMLTAAALVLAVWMLPRDLGPREVSWQGWSALASCFVIGGLLIRLRGLTWVSGSAGPEHVELAGRDLPWIGPLTLALCLTFVVASAMYLTFGVWVPLLVPGALTWACAMATAVVIALAHLAHSVRPPSIASSVDLGRVHLAPVIYLAACATATVLMALMISSARRSDW